MGFVIQAPEHHLLSMKQGGAMFAKTLGIELRELYAFLKRNWTETAVISLSTLFLMLSKYYPLHGRWQNHMLYFFVLPIISIVVVLRRNPLDFGLRPGKAKIWGFHLLAYISVMFAIVAMLSGPRSLFIYGLATP